MTRLLFVLAAVAGVPACGGSVTSAATDAGAAESVPDADAGAAESVPDADIYGCEAAPPGSAGCASMLGDPGAIYPQGCVVTTTTSLGFCSPGVGCAVRCACHYGPIPDGGLSWVCPG